MTNNDYNYDGSVCFSCRVSLPVVDIDIDHHGLVVPRYCKTCEEAIWNAEGYEMPENTRSEDAWKKMQEQED